MYQGIDKVTELIGRSIAWLTLLMMLITLTVVILRYGFNIPSIALQESVVYLHATVFMAAAGYTLKHNGHVRVDIIYRQVSPKARCWTNLLGSLFLLLPVCIFIAWVSWDYVNMSWSVHEKSQEAGGIPAVFLLKTLLLIMPALLIFQGLAEIFRNLFLLIDSSALENEHEQGGMI